MLSVKGIFSGYGKVVVLHDVNIKVEKGEVVMIIGANGAGKSTLLKTIFGALRPSKGSIVFNGQRIDGRKTNFIVKMGIVQILEGRGILSRMTVKENLEMGAYSRSDKDCIKGDMYRVLERFPVLKQKLNQNAGTLSGGEQQILAIGRGLLARPQLLLMDEPSLGLAPVLVEFIFQTIHDLRDRDGYTILLVEQNANQALSLSDRGYVLETGRVVLEGESKALGDNEEVQRAYLGKAGETFQK